MMVFLMLHKKTASKKALMLNHFVGNINRKVNLKAGTKSWKATSFRQLAKTVSLLFRENLFGCFSQLFCQF